MKKLDKKAILHMHYEVGLCIEVISKRTGYTYAEVKEVIMESWKKGGYHAPKH